MIYGVQPKDEDPAVLKQISVSVWWKIKTHCYKYWRIKRKYSFLKQYPNDYATELVKVALTQVNRKMGLHRKKLYCGIDHDKNTA